METIAALDGYIEKMIKEWHGKVIITAHHGIICYKDMFVPYIIKEGGKQE